MERGPFNVVFHGIQPDFMEDQMADDPEFRDIDVHTVVTLYL